MLHYTTNTPFYIDTLEEIKKRIRDAQTKAILSVNSEMINMYWDIGELIYNRQKREGWGAKTICKLSKDIHNEIPEIKGFSERNIKFMVQLYKVYVVEYSIGKQPVSQLEKRKQIVSQIPWGHNILIMQRIKDMTVRFWYMGQIIKNGWNRDTLSSMIKSELHKRQGKLNHNFDLTLPKPQSNLVKQTLKDPYIFDFITLSDPFQERELETELVKYLEQFLIELGAGFAFLGRQYKLTIAEQDFYLDLFFYHIKLRCFVVVELKKGKFKPEYAGKMNFYCSAVDDIIKQSTDQPTIGLILCESKNRIFAEYSLKDLNKPIGISEYELTKLLPDNLKSSLPSIKEIETELIRLNKTKKE
ncbi:MAG: PDDEXK nuclease domain-containing protein [Candidatus Cloacimonetes bacterium]|nr:PDDEXK nuclease domain-containing protein [Candidatus Cloacimonadota bacterium]